LRSRRRLLDCREGKSRSKERQRGWSSSVWGAERCKVMGRSGRARRESVGWAEYCLVRVGTPNKSARAGEDEVDFYSVLGAERRGEIGRGRLRRVGEVFATQTSSG